MTDSTEKSGLFHSTDYKLKTLLLVTSDGQSLDLLPIMLEMNIYEDIFSPTMSGDIQLGDAADIISSFKLHGNEYLIVEIDKPSLENPISKVFRTYKISNRSFETNSLQNYTIHFCSEELILSTENLISKSYKGLRIDQIVNDILVSKLGVDKKKLESGIFTETKGTFDLIVPRMQPLEAIQWLVPRAYNDNENLFFFFENRDGFNFTSFENLISQPIYNTYARNVKINNNVDENFNSLNYIKVVEDFDIIKAIRYGTYSSSMIVLDLISRKFSFSNYTAKQQNTLLNNQIPINDLKNRLGQSLVDTKENMLKYVVTKDSDPTTNPEDVKNWMLKTSSKLGQINNFKMIISIGGDVMIKVGSVVFVKVPKMLPQTQVTEDDDMRSGRYLVSSVRHKFTSDIMVTIIELLSDSVNTTLATPDQTSQALSKLIKL